jgi:hypothetical protein
MEAIAIASALPPRNGCLLANDVSITMAAADSAEKTVTTLTSPALSLRNGTEATKESEKPTKFGRTGSLLCAPIPAPFSKISN